MPRKELTIDGFTGFSNSQNPRDIPDDSFAVPTTGISVTKKGSAKLINSPQEVSASIINDLTGVLSDGYGLFSYSTDYEIQDSGNISAYGASGGNRLVTVDAHNLSIGDKIYIAGISSTKDGYFTITEIVSTTQFIILDAESGSASSLIAKFIKIAEYKDYNDPNLAISSGEKVSILDKNGYRSDSISLSRSVDNYGITTDSNDVTNVRHAMYYDNGILRLSDGNFDNVDNAVNKALVYIPDRTYFNFIGFTPGSGYNQNSVVPWYPASWNDGTGNLEYFNTVDTGRGFSLHESTYDSVSIIYGNITEYNPDFNYSISFNLIDSSEDGNRLSGPERLPQVFIYGESSPSSITQTVRTTDPAIGKIGHNHLTLSARSGYTSILSAASFVFFANKATTYTITDVRVSKAPARVTTYTPGTSPKYTGYTSGVERGWYEEPQEIIAPSDFGHLHDSTYASQGQYTGIGNIPGSDQGRMFPNSDTEPSSNFCPFEDTLVMTINKDNDIINSDWLFGMDIETQGEHSYLSFAHTWVYDSMGDDGQESLLYDRGDGIYALRDYRELSTGSGVWQTGFAHIDSAIDGVGLKFQVMFRVGTPSNRRRVGARLYITGHSPNIVTAHNGIDIVSTAAMLEDPLLFAEIDFQTGVTLFDGTHANYRSSQDGLVSSASFEGISKFPSMTYRLQNNMKHDVSSIYARYGHSTIANRRCYIGSVRQKAEGDLTSINRTDRMLVSPVGKLDTFPSDSYIDIGVNDGQTITALENFNDRILQFKHQTLYIINIAGDYDYLELKLEGRGVKQQSAVTRTEIGIAWFNETGCFIYDGDNVTNLIEEKIALETWRSFASQGTPIIGYSMADRNLICRVSGGYTYIYNFSTEAWVHYEGDSSAVISNMVTYRRESGALFLQQALASMSDTTFNAHHTTLEVQGQKAEALIEVSAWTTSALDDTLNQKNSSGVAKRISNTGNIADEAIDFAAPFTTESEAQLAQYALDQNLVIPVHNHGEDEYNYAASVTQDIASIMNRGAILVYYKCNNYGSNQNSNLAGNSGLYGASDADLSIDSGRFFAPSGGVNPVAGVTTLTITRDNTDAGDQYVIYSNIKNAEAAHADYASAQYTSVAGDNANDVAAGLKAAMDLSLWATYARGSVSSNVITLTALPISPADTRPLDKGYWRFQDNTFFVGVQSDALDRTIQEWTPDIGSQNQSYIALTTADFDFDEPNTRKKFYRAYVTYRCTGDSKIEAKFSINGLGFGSSIEKTFQSNSDYNFSGTSDALATFDTTAGVWKRATLRPTTSSEGNNIYSLQLHFSGGEVPADFEINDITVIYRIKNPR